jgi:hypothetical protein
MLIRLKFVAKERGVTASEYVRGLVSINMEKDADNIEILKRLVTDEGKKDLL